jgi:Orotidine 5'-phosphate decarboxylase / HUMPS family
MSTFTFLMVHGSQWAGKSLLEPASVSARRHGRCCIAGASTTAAPPKRLTYEARAALAQNAMAKRCLELMAEKETNLAVAVDVATADEMLAIADKVGPHVCVLKTHVDIFDKWDAGVVKELQVRAQQRHQLPEVVFC